VQLQCHLSMFVGGSAAATALALASQLPVPAVRHHSSVQMAASQPLDMSMLTRRIEGMRSSTGPICTVVLLTMLPRQQLKVRASPTLCGVLQSLRADNQSIGVLGSDLEKKTVLPFGVEASITDLVSREDGSADVTLVSDRVFEHLEAEAPSKPGQVRTSRVRWLDFSLSDELEAKCTTSRALELASREMGSLVAQWTHAVREQGSDATSRKLDSVLDSLGELPAASRPSERAFWVAALVHPQPSLDVTLDIRPAMLSASNALERLTIAKTCLVGSIHLMRRGQGPINSFYC